MAEGSAQAQIHNGATTADTLKQKRRDAGAVSAGHRGEYAPGTQNQTMSM